ncbi:protein LTV1 homolog isoform X2 [Macrobrachium nipponense]|uniref:protein LTV1 homolog isoform X2 n=1 Tax=Macrobrachium nipponense TaxID=159736 RepID=UPI0030C8B19B
MEGKKSKKFIDRRRDVLHTFKVVARSQRDPLVADETAPQSVLQPSEVEEQKAEQQKYGIYFDDDYNYLQHLRGVREAVNWDDEELEVYTIRKEDPQANKKELRKQKLVLPSSVFESFLEEPIGLLNKAAPLTGPRPELDPDVVARLDDDLIDDETACNPDDEDALPDNFVVMLNSETPIHEFDNDEEWEDCDDYDVAWENDLAGCHHLPALSKLSAYREQSKEEGYDADEEERDFSSDFNDSDDEERDELGSLDGPPKTFREEETASHFTNYSLSSSVLRRNEGLSVLDDCFEEKFVREYDDEQVGALDGEDIDGFIGEDSPLFKQVLEKAKKQLQAEPEDEKTRIINWIKDMQQRIDEDKEKVQIELSDSEPGEKWDCETILSTYSTQYNHPRTITDPPRRKKIAVNPRTGIPLEHGVEGLTKKALVLHNNQIGGDSGKAQLDTETLITSMSTISIRPPGETSDERRFRKKALKELRRERRSEKKLNRCTFKDEKKRLEKISMNNRYNNKISLV